jgi:predicted porin
LGKGLKANFQLEYDLTDIGTGGNGNSNQTTTNGSADTTTAVNGTSTGINNGFGARQSWLSLSSSAFGELKLGRTAQAIHGVIANGLAGAGNNVAGSLYSSGSNAASETRAGIRAHNVYVNRAITYTTPTMSGVSVQLQHGSQSIDSETTAARAAVTSNSETGGSITYTGVKNLTVAYGISKLDYNTASVTSLTADTKTQAQALTANYNFGPAAAFFVAQEKKVNVYSWKVDKSFKWKQLIPAVSVFAGANITSANNPYHFSTKAGISPKVILITQNHFGDGSWVLVTNTIADYIGTEFPSSVFSFFIID